MIRFFLTIFAYLFFTALGFCIWVILFRIPAFERNFPILFYRGLAIAACAALLQFVVMLVSRRRASAPPQQSQPLLHLKDLWVICALTLSFNITFLTVIPVTIDRSVTVFLLGQLAAAPKQSLTAHEMSERLKSIYVKRYQAVDRRMREQILSGNVEATDGNYALTEQGNRFISLSKRLADWFELDPRLVNPPSTDAAEK